MNIEDVDLQIGDGGTGTGATAAVAGRAGGTGPIVMVGSQANNCAHPTCDEARAVVLADTPSSITPDGIIQATSHRNSGTAEGVYGVGFGRLALGPSCSGTGRDDLFDTIGYEKFVSALGSQARQQIDQLDARENQPQPQSAGPIDRNVGGGGGIGKISVAGGDET